jgi:DNA mismatch repair protein MutS
MSELLELLAIIKRNNSSTIILGDEICKGTEEKSANIIISYMLENFSKNKTSFITATHLHNLTKLNTIQNLKNIKIKHLKITLDEANDMLIYDRNLLDGQGDTFYGLQVAKYLMKDMFFNQRTTEILNEYDILTNNISIENQKNSKYNSNLYINKCEICKSTEKLETHHIIWQKDFINNINNNNYYIHKNDISNLVILCLSCHDQVDKGTIIINKWIETSNGKYLDYKITNIINKKHKYNDNIINYIYDLKKILNSLVLNELLTSDNYNNISIELLNEIKLAQININDKFNIKISKKYIFNKWIK